MDVTDAATAVYPDAAQSLFQRSADESATKDHPVQYGDTIENVAAAHGTTVDAIRAANPGETRNAGFLYPGDVLRIPASSTNEYTSQPEIIASGVNPHPGIRGLTATIDPVPKNQDAVNRFESYTTTNLTGGSRRDYNADIGGTQTWTKIVQATPYYIDEKGNQQLLKLKEAAPTNARHVYYNATETLYARRLEQEPDHSQAEECKSRTRELLHGAC
jgi:Tfp pilus assembly protein FimV